MDAFDRFGCWVKWAGGTSAAAGKLGWHPTQVTRVKARKRRPRVDYAVHLQRVSADWPDGPIRVEEWAEVEATPTGGEAA